MGYRRSDVTYDVVSVWGGAFFRLDQLRRFRESMEYFRLIPRESGEAIRSILHELVRRAGLREAYVAMDCLRGSAPRTCAGIPRMRSSTSWPTRCLAYGWCRRKSARRGCT